jgi:hypothetical protein
LAFDAAAASSTEPRGARAFDMDLPVSVAGLTVRADNGGLAPGDVTLQPLSVTPGPVSIDEVAEYAVAYGDSVVYFAGEGAFPEATGFWVRSGIDVAVAIVRPGGTLPLAVRLRNAPVANRVTIRAGDVDERWEMPAEGERVFTFPPAATRVIVLRIRAERGIRPADRDPANRDMRRLGVWVEIVRT